MLGKISKPALSAKAAETLGLLEFCVYQLESNPDKIADCKPHMECRGNLLLKAGIAALKFESEMQTMSHHVTAEGREQLDLSFSHFVQCFWRAGGTIKPKVHLMWHMVDRTCMLGNPKYYSTYKDESVNGTIARIAHSCHRAKWNHTVHIKYFALEKMGKTLSMHPQ